MSFDVVIVGGGIVGLACAWAARQKQRKVLVVDKDDACVGASIRNFGFVTVTGQGRGLTWRRAMKTRDIWAEIAPQAGIPIVQNGLLVLAKRGQARQVLVELAETAEGGDLQCMNADELASRFPQFADGHFQAGLFSPHELRLESRQAIGQLASWLEGQGVTFMRGSSAQRGEDGQVVVEGQRLVAEHTVWAPGADILGFDASIVSKHQIRTCRLSMVRIRPPKGYVLPHPVMSDLSLVRYQGYAEMPASAALREVLVREQAEYLAHGIHLIVVQSADGTLVVGDSHHYASSIEPFASARTEELILREMQTLLRLPSFEVDERWVGYYPSGKNDALIEPLGSHSTLVSVTSGTGMSTGFALAQEWAERL